MKNTNEELELYREVYAMTGDIVYKYSIADDSIVIYRSSDVNSRNGAVINNYLDILRKQSYTEEEKKCLDAYIDAISTGKTGFFEMEINLKFNGSAGNWYTTIGKTIYDDNNEPVSVIGKLIPSGQNYNSDANAATLRENIDSLTGVLKSAEFKKQFAVKCEEYNGVPGGFIIVTVRESDNGYGAEIEKVKDNAYIDVVQRLRRLFYYNAIIGRIKPDEFVVAYYGRDISTEFLNKVDDFKDDLNDMEIHGVKDGAISVSGGVYCGPFERDRMFEILNKASMAMAFAKYNGGNTIQIYTEDLEEVFHTYNSESRRIKNSIMKIEHKLIKNTLEVLTDKDDVDQTILELFEIVGKEYNLDKVVMYEFDIAGQKIDNTYFWDKMGNSAPVLKKTSIDYRTIDWFNLKTEMAVASDASQVKESDPLSVIMTESLKSFVVAGFQVGSVAACISFENHTAKHKWLESELKIFEIVRRLVSTCLINIRLYREMLSNSRNTNNLDALTGLYKQNVFREEANKYIALHGDEKLGIVSVKLDGFLRINEYYGFEAGDDILRKYAQVLKDNTHRFIMGSRLNADNIVALVKLFDDRGSILSEATVDVLYNDFMQECRNKYPVVELKIKSGLARIANDGCDISAYIAFADKIKFSK